MNRHDVVQGFLALACAIVLAVPVTAAPITPAAESLSPATLRFRRAIAEQVAGRRDEVIRQLEPIDWSVEPDFPGADRAAFLLAQAYQAEGADDRFARLARTVSLWRRPTPFTRWLVQQWHLRDAAAGDPTSLQALGEDDPLLGAWAQALTRSAAGASDESELIVLSSADTTRALGRDLAGFALVRRATRALARGEDATALLTAVPAGSRYAARAARMLGLAAFEAGRSAEGRAALERSLVADSAGHEPRRTRLALAGDALERGAWADAHAAYDRAEWGWRAQHDSLEWLAASGNFDAIWRAWERAATPAGPLRLDGDALRRSADAIALDAANLGHDAAVPALVPEAVPPSESAALLVDPPAADEWRSVAAAARASDGARYDLAAARREYERERAALERQRHYLAFGLDRVRREKSDLEARLHALDSLQSALKQIEARLKSVRDTSAQRLARRAARLLEQLERQSLWMSAMRHFDVDGPQHERASVAPPGHVSADSLLAREQSHAGGVRALTQRLADETPALIARSYDAVWKPGMVDRVTRLQAEAREALAWARRLEASVDSGLVAAQSSAEARRLAAAVAAAERHADSLARAHETLRTAVARSAVARTLAHMDHEREPIEYGLAVAAYAIGVRLLGDGSTAPAAADSSAADDSTTLWRGRAREALERFLAHHPQSPERGEVRFRLADVTLIELRQRFRESMATFLRDQERGGGAGVALPVMDASPAIALYQRILDEDPGFKHRDAVLYDIGMLRLEAGDPGAERHFQELVAQHPDSRYVQEAHLRMGDMRFGEKRFTECIPHYTLAAAGPDPSLKAIALYKSGWAHFNQDRFLAAAESFRSVLDLYESGQQVKTNVDLRNEAESYLIHTLARGGGARAFGAFFDPAGQRPYERRILMALGQHFRRFSLYGDAAATDSLSLRRFPLEADALVSAQRLTETYRRWDRGENARQAMLDVAPRFAPNSPWARAQASDSVRQAGAAFARDCWMTVALHHRDAARKANRREDWAASRDLYARLLELWPADSTASSLHLLAGEASAKLDDPVAALGHYADAARSGPDSLARQALYQRVAVADAWYESTRASGPKGRSGTGRDSLAQRLIAEGDALLARFPAHPSALDVTWRQANLAFAHGWFPRAAEDFGRLATQAPSDARAPQAAVMRADALFKLGDYAGAGDAFALARDVAKSAGRDSIVRRAEAALPVCYYRHADSVRAEHPKDVKRWAPLYERVATEWPNWTYAHTAQYRAGIGHLEAGHTEAGVAAMEKLIRAFPKSEYVKDAHLQIARAWESDKRREQAAGAYVAFAERFPADSSAGDATLKAADLYTDAGLTARADTLRLAYIRRHPEDRATAMEVYESFARRELAALGEHGAMSSLLPAAPAGKPKRGAPPAPARSHVAEYLRRAAADPALASKSLIGEIRFRQGEESRAAYEVVRLTQPLAKSIPVKQKQLDALLARYRATVDVGDPTWAHAASVRIGEALIHFGEALENSERPADLKGDDLLGYEDVLHRQSQTFFDRGEGVWSDLLRQKARLAKKDDPWIPRARAALWTRLANRFLFRPEVEFPLVQGETTRRDSGEATTGALVPGRDARNPKKSSPEGDPR